MLGITIKNMLKSKFLNICLIIGFILSVAAVSTVPMYSNSVLDHFLHSKFIEANKKQTPPGGLYVNPASIVATNTIKYGKPLQAINKDHLLFKSDFDKLIHNIPAPVLSQKVTMTMESIKYQYTNDGKNYISSSNNLLSVEGIEKHINIVKGTNSGNFSDENNCVDVIVDEKTFNNLKLELDKVYTINTVVQLEPLKMKVTGVFQIKSKDDPFWLDKANDFYCQLITSESSISSLLKRNDNYISYLKKITYSVVFDYTKINSKNAKEVYTNASKMYDEITNRSGQTVFAELFNNMKDYMDKVAHYETVMWMFLMPVLLVVIYYIAMISGFLVDSDKEQIAALKSRGASKFEIMRMYLYEGILLSALSLICGPLLGIAFCKIISYSSGFMQFSTKYSINISPFSWDVYIYALITTAILLATLLLSVYSAAQKSIVEVKQSKYRYLTAFLKNKNMDIILLAISGYGYYNYAINKSIPVMSSTNAGKTPVDPLLYLVSTIFIIGLGLLFLRLYNYLLKLIFLLSKKKASSSIYISLINVLRYHMKKKAVMLFVVTTVALGIYNIKVAKNINVSFENTVKCKAGADLRIQGDWSSTDSSIASNDALNSGSIYKEYYEPPYSPYSKVQGINQYTKVLFFQFGGSAGLADDSVNESALMGIIPHEFGKIAWFDRTLLPYHWYNYLNLLTEQPGSVLISRGLSNSASIKRGDTIQYRLDDGLFIKSVVQEVVDYWPGFDNLQKKNAVIGNFDYMIKKMSMQPYEIWMQRNPNFSYKQIFESMIKEGASVVDFRAMDLDMYNAKNDVFLKGTNAILTLVFISITIITIIGFIIYWMLSLKSRTLQFGILRAIGLSSKGISTTLMLEQIFTLGSSILLGLIVGNITSLLFEPLLNELWYKSKFALPVANLTYYSEYLRLGIVLVGVFVVSLLILRRYISTLKINQAIKLGED